MTAFADITGLIMSVLSAAPAVSPNILRARPTAMAKSWITAVNVHWDAGTPDYGQINGAPADWQSKYTVECYAKGVAESGDLAVDPLLGEVYSRLAADSTLGGRVEWIRLLHVEASTDSVGEQTGWIGMTYLVSHRTANDNLNLTSE